MIDDCTIVLSHLSPYYPHSVLICDTHSHVLCGLPFLYPSKVIEAVWYSFYFFSLVHIYTRQSLAASMNHSQHLWLSLF